jgi:hypothetical protein
LESDFGKVGAVCAHLFLTLVDLVDKYSAALSSDCG